MSKQYTYLIFIIILVGGGLILQSPDLIPSFPKKEQSMEILTAISEKQLPPKPNLFVEKKELPSVQSSETLMTKNEFLEFCKENHSKVYQDIFINGEVLLQGVNLCANRYEVLQPILNTYTNHFSVLDLGSGQGYFPFRIATDYPKAQCVLVEHYNDKEKHYSHHQDMLWQMCHLNSHLNNISYLHKDISVAMLEQLNENEHFDLILALLVIHQADWNMEGRIKMLDQLLKLGDRVVIEVSNDVASELRDYVREQLSQSTTHDCKYLGEVQRCYDPSTAYNGKYPNGKGEFYLFTIKQKTTEFYGHPQPQKIKLSTFKAMEGVYTSALLEN